MKKTVWLEYLLKSGQKTAVLRVVQQGEFSLWRRLKKFSTNVDKANIFLSQIFVVNIHKSFSLFMEKIFWLRNLHLKKFQIWPEIFG